MAVRIGINALYLIPGEVGGTEIYLRRLLKALYEIDQLNEYVLYVNRETDAALVPSGNNFCLVRCAVAARIRPLRVIYEQTLLPALLKRHRIAVLFNPGYTGPVAAPCPAVSVFHDLQHKVHPEFFLPAHLPFWNLLLWASARKSKTIIAVSQETAADLAEYMPFAGPKISVVPHGVDTAFSAIAEKRRLHPDRIEPFLLTVSTLHPHKNLERLIEAFAVFRAQRPQYRLVVAGLRGFATARIEERVRLLHLSNSVELTGWIPQADLYSLFERAHSFIGPSLFEGFGLTLPEALAAGIPTACSDIPVFNSLAGTAALRFNPLSVPAIADAMLKVTGDEVFRDFARAAGPAQVQSLRWTSTAARTLEELVSAVATNRKDCGKTLSSVLPPPAR